jgi:hypothetical protein
MDESQKIFVVSRQKCGTTSTGNFLRDHGINCLSPDGFHNRLWAMQAQSGQYDEIFDHPLFSSFDAYEDDPWWMRGVPSETLNRFPNAKFILMKRDSNAWFQSMMAHFNEYGGFGSVHAMEYQRTEFYHKYLNSNRGLIRNEFPFEIKPADSEHYIDLYNKRNEEIFQLFDERGKSSQLIQVHLEDPEKWLKIGEFLSLKVKNDYDSIANKKSNRSKKKETRVHNLVKEMKWLIKNHWK